MDARAKQNLTLALKELEEDIFHILTCAEEAGSSDLAEIIYSMRQHVKKAQRYLDYDKVET